MNKNKKSTPKAKMLTAVLLILFFGSCAVLVFAILTGQLDRTSKNDPTEPVTSTEIVTTAPSTESTTLPSTEPVSSTAANTSGSSELALGSRYNVDYWIECKEENGTPGLALLFGVRTQGAEVTFEDDRFTVFYVSYDEYVPVAEGYYSFVSDSEIELRYDNSYIATATVIETEDGFVTVMDFPLDIEGTTLRLGL